MSRECIVCHKGAIPGMKYKRRGQIKRTGGAGSKIVGKSFRRFHANLQRIKVNINGTIKRALVCTSCIQGGRIVKG